MKRLISILLSIFFVISAMPTVMAADNTKNIQKREMLDALGIMSIENDSEFVTRKEFFDGLLHMLYDSVDETMVRDILVQKGILFDKSDALFSADTFITYNDAVAAVVTILGYEKISQLSGEYPQSYIKAAQEIGILAGVAGNRTLSLSRNSLVNLFCNVIEAEPFVFSLTSMDRIGEIAEDETILSIERDIYEVKGIIEANQYTSLISETGNTENQVTINGKKYYVNGTDANDMLGCYVKGYVQFDDEEDDGKILYLGVQDRTSELIIQDENIYAMSENCRRLEYYREGSNSLKTLKISPTVKVIYNGKFFDKYTASDFELKDGSLRLLDNNSDNVYDCIFISSNETMVVEYTTNDYEIYGRYKYTDALNYLNLDDVSEKQNIRYYLEGEEVDFSSIKKEDVLTIQRSKGEKDFVAKIYISRNVSTGYVGRVDEKNNKITIDGAAYNLTKALCDELAFSGKLTLTDNYIFYFDYFGKLAYAKVSATTDYCLFYKISEDYYGDTDYKLKYMNDSSEWITAPVANRVNYNGETCLSSVLYSQLKDAKPQVMIIKQNSRGEIKFITTAKLGETGSSALTKTAEQEMSYHSKPKAFNYKLYLESDTKVFIIPDIPTNDEEAYYVATRSYFASERSYTITSYNTDEFNFTKLVSVTESQATRKGKVGYEMAVVTDIIQTLDEYNMPTTKVTCSIGSYIFEYEVDDDANPEGLQRGSVIRIHLDKEKKKINNWANVSDKLDSLTDSMRDDCFLYGTVVANNPTEGKLKIESDGTEGFFRHDSAATILVYSMTEKTCRVGSYSDLTPGTNIYLHTYFAVPEEIVIIKK